MRVVAIIQARMGSTRLPGKVALDICGRPMLAHVVERVRTIRGIDEVVVATSRNREDDSIIKLCECLSVTWYRGPNTDVLSRYLGAGREHCADAVVRVTSDCPLLDPVVSSRVVELFRQNRPDYAANTLVRTFPRGLDTEVVSVETLEIASREAKEKADREHVTSFVRKRPERFRLLSVEGEGNESHHRWTVDTAADIEFVRTILGQQGEGLLRLESVLKLLENRPEWISINAHIKQKSI